MNFLNHPIVLVMLFVAIFYLGHRLYQKAIEIGHSKGYKEGLSVGRLQVLEEDILRNEREFEANENLKKLINQTCISYR